MNTPASRSNSSPPQPAELETDLPAEAPGHNTDAPGGAPLAPVPSARPHSLGRYRISGELGGGTFGVVYKGRDNALGRDVAIKVPRPEIVELLGGIDAYLREAQVVAALAHPHIVPVHDLGHTPDGLCYVVYDFIHGSDLKARLQRGPRLEFQDATRLVADLADVLHHAHQRRIFHRDVKPANILIDTSGKPYLTDFGLALRDADQGSGEKFAGTPAYMSPEQARHESHRVDGRSDIFSLGAVFFELLTGQRPFQGKRDEILDRIANGDPQPPRQLDPAIPAELQRITLKAMARLLRDRYTTAADFAGDLRSWLAEQTRAGVVDAPSSAARSAGQGQPDDAGPVRIVPRGLRSFDGRDADFFLDLLPGVRERDGIPSALQFWKSRLEATDSDTTFAIGLLYGPSGCGKSSLVKAGLVPRLARHVIGVYIEATAEDTEARLLRGLRKACPALAAGLDLVETTASLRQGRGLATGQKVVLILDQFEQWLHARRLEDNPELARALRHCDGGRVQALLLIRDDFYMAATRFMQGVEVLLQEGHNQAAVDLFDPRHARKVLAAFGRAYEALPADGSLSESESRFLDGAVDGLAEDGRVISRSPGAVRGHGQGSRGRRPPCKRSAASAAWGWRSWRRPSARRPPHRPTGCTNERLGPC